MISEKKSENEGIGIYMSLGDKESMGDNVNMGNNLKYILKQYKHLQYHNNLVAKFFGAFKLVLVPCIPKYTAYKAPASYGNVYSDSLNLCIGKYIAHF